MENGIIFIVLAFAAFVFYAILRNDRRSESLDATKGLTKSSINQSHSPRLVEHNVAYPPVKPKYTSTGYGLVSGKEKQNESFGVDDVKRAVASVAVSVTGKTSLDSAKGKSDVVRVTANDQNDYFVAADLGDKKKAANKLAEIHRRSQYLLQAIDEQLDGNRRIISGDGKDITDNMKQLVRSHYKKKTPFAEYHNPSDLTVGSNSDKGTVIETCLRSKYDPKSWNSDNTLFRVHTHELAHSADFHFREDGEEAHGPVFKRLHQYLLQVSENLGLYNCAEYKASGNRFCGVKLTEDYCGNGGEVRKRK